VGVVRIEAEPQVTQKHCERCHGTTWMIRGYVYMDEEPHGIYAVDWCEGSHPERVAYVTLSFGDYVEEAVTGADRLAFCIETRSAGMGLTHRPVHDRPEFLGRFLPREEALQWEHLDDLWHVCDHLTDDRRFAAVAAWICGDLDTALDADDDAPARS
jgi:hypothetical protein